MGNKKHPRDGGLDGIKLTRIVIRVIRETSVVLRFSGSTQYTFTESVPLGKCHESCLISEFHLPPPTNRVPNISISNAEYRPNGL